MEGNQQYWNGIEELEGGAAFEKARKNEFAEDLPIEEKLADTNLELTANRRDFLKLFGFGLTAAALAACTETPVKKVIPYVIKPDDVTPGVASFYASTCMSSGIPVLVKTREGRPIKMEGNELSPFAGSGVSHISHASVLDLYDSTRASGPMAKGEAATWEAVDGEIMKRLDTLKASGKVRFLSSTVFSPSSQALINEFMGQFADAKHVQYDAYSVSAIADAHLNLKQKRAIPSYDFSKADVVVSFGADYLNTWVSPTQFTRQWASRRNPEENNGKMSRTFQFESMYSLTGGNADYRWPFEAADLGKALITLYNKVTGESLSGGLAGDVGGNLLTKAANELKANRGKSLVVCGVNNVYYQELIVRINDALGNYGSTTNIEDQFNLKQGNDQDMTNLVGEMNSGVVDALIMLDVNPSYNYPAQKMWGTGLEKVKQLTVSFSSKADETAAKADFLCPANHPLESWGDASQMAGLYTICQPTIRPLFDTRQMEDSLLTWMGKDESYYDYLRDFWKTNFYGGSGFILFEDFWRDTLRTGFFQSDNAPAADAEEVVAEAAPVIVEGEEAAAETGSSNSAMDSAAGITAYGAKMTGTTLYVYQKGSILDGKHANNPWLQETPDAITKVTWDNYVLVPYLTAKANGWKEGQLMSVSAGSFKADLPMVVQPGQAKNTCAIAVGYGRGSEAGKVAGGVGVNAFPGDFFMDGSFSHMQGGATISPAGGKYDLAKTQTFIGYDDAGTSNDLETKHYGRIRKRLDNAIVKETTLKQWSVNPLSGNENRAKIQMDNDLLTLWDKHDKQGHWWFMGIDMNKCTGCGSCIVSCNAENNVAVVGKHEVLVRRDMHWMRLDRYYKDEPGTEPGSNPKMLSQPMMCQHCDNAPCETVCPVLATMHSNEGLNQQVYNRCIGTRYCANNCPYKVRRFNWFSYYDNAKYTDVNFAQQDKLGRLVLNPDVTVRARGVMEKCSFCVQRIQAGKLTAKKEGRRPKDGEIKTACQQSCPADAIIFGDLNDPTSKAAQFVNNKRNFHVLEEIKTLPSVGYLVKIRNQDEALSGAGGHGAPSHEEEHHAEEDHA